MYQPSFGSSSGLLITTCFLSLGSPLLDPPLWGSSSLCLSLSLSLSSCVFVLVRFCDAEQDLCILVAGMVIVDQR